MDKLLPSQLNRSGELPDLYEAGVKELQNGLDEGHFTSVDLVKAYIARIEEVNSNGPQLRAVLEINQNAVKDAASLDEERKRQGKRTLLHGIPVLIKVCSAGSSLLNTTAGSYALLGSIVPDDAGVVKRLREAGAIILGKTNMSEWAHFRGNNMICGWSARGGQCKTAYHPRGDPCGSSSGSGVAMSIGLATVAIGTETDGSISCPSSTNNIVGIKPTVGLTSRAGVIPIAAAQDTVGPMVRSVQDAAIVLSIIAGPDPNDKRTISQPQPVPDYLAALNPNTLQGKRIGVPRTSVPEKNHHGSPIDPYVSEAFQQALKTLESLGAVIVDPANLPSAKEILSWDENLVLKVDFKIELNEYLSALKNVPTGVRTLTDLIKFNNDHKELELPEHYQDHFIRSEGTNGRDKAYGKALAQNLEAGATRGIDAALKEHNLDALVLPSEETHTPAALAGYPIVTVPLGFYPETTPPISIGPETSYPTPGSPIGLSFYGTAFSEFDLIGYAYAFEQATKTRLSRKAYPEAIPKTQLKDVLT
ncbi:amidase signature enzyme [Dendrothele bispora CBS 962.96]|uniref:Amidase signature enzyme n=1 Tax=Dendrothele bispora (strain CBS 962.96) TaxID=1314807 RepID=A0A4S8M841_DENBC|nr:amidase signature enzyme [Dendrothele bispora CBS 962.96]